MGLYGSLRTCAYFNLKLIITRRLFFVTKKKEDAFDWTKAILNLELSEMMKKGVSYYIICNNLNPKTKKELNKICEDYKKLPIGE